LEYSGARKKASRKGRDSRQGRKKGSTPFAKWRTNYEGFLAADRLKPRNVPYKCQK